MTVRDTRVFSQCDRQLRDTRVVTQFGATRREVPKGWLPHDVAGQGRSEHRTGAATTECYH